MASTITMATPVFNNIAALVRYEGLDGQDVRDIAASVENGEAEYVGAGQLTWSYVLQASDDLSVSAFELVDYAVETVLGW